MDAAGRVPEIKEPTFTILHSYPPHPPFVFNQSGEVRKRSEYKLDGGWAIEQYIDQLIYLNRVVIDLIDGILEQSDKEPIIIIQSDHGPISSWKEGSWKKGEPITELNQWERSGILNAYLLPGRCSSSLYPSITPVNSFRLVFDECFGTDFGLLEDQTWSNPQDWIRNWTSKEILGAP